MADTQIINSGTKRRGAYVNGNGFLHTFSVIEEESRYAVETGNAYNINTGPIASIAAESAILYFKNDEDNDFFISSFAVGIDNQGTHNGTPEIYIVRNPTAGTIVSGASAVSQKINRNFSSTKTLKSTTLAYKGATGNTFTDGTDGALFMQSPNGRLFATVDFSLGKGSSFGIRINPKLSSGTVTVYAAIIGFVKDPDNNPLI